MTNRERYILNRNEYDMLIGLHAALGSGLCQCVIEAITAKDYYCPDDKVCTIEACKECIQKWLNERC